jgi:glucose uptake protein GlcU
MDKITNLFGLLLDQWQQASLVDFGNMVLAVVLLGWFMTRFVQR